MSEKPFTIIVLILLLIAITFYLRSESEPAGMSTGGANASVDNFGPAPDISMPIGLNGKPVDLSSLHDHVVMLDFWATWCGPCKLSIPELERIYEKHKAEGLEVVGISVDDPRSIREVDAQVKSMGMTYPIALASKIPDLSTKYPFASIPLLVIVDKKGIIRAHISGFDPDGNNDDLVAKLLKEK